MRFLMMGFRYCRHSLDTRVKRAREAASIALQIHWGMSAKLFKARMPVIALCAG
ncbi:Uncharacterised protein [Mycobacterium tuberculosis]|nr:Uncharacterised protein [Mycobacterium tuberculosis]